MCTGGRKLISVFSKGLFAQAHLHEILEGPENGLKVFVTLCNKNVILNFWFCPEYIWAQQVWAALEHEEHNKNKRSSKEGKC